ncbi:MAG: DUF1835 domain-containing protein [Gemmatimonadaceae bacterium]|nr:DUF1835 domain-containing protein [Gemmatimonadaceae bacterium]
MMTLHVTNGDVAAQGLARSGLPGDVLAWRDVLHDGPVPYDDDRSTFIRTRAQFLADRRWATELEATEDFEARDERFDGIGADDAIMLWFEPDLYDQLQLIQVLSRLARREAHARPTIAIAPADLMLGSVQPEKFRPLYEARRVIDETDLAHGAAAWAAYTSTTPASLFALVQQLDTAITSRTFAGDAHVRLPYLTATLRRVLEEYPDVDTGLSRSERQICEALAPGVMTLGKLYRASHHTSESWAWMSDASFAWYMQRLSDVAQPLITHTNGLRVLAPAGSGMELQAFWDRTVQLTPFGSDVVRARIDHISANGVDRWIGGAHQTTAQHWRWDARVQGPVAQGER